MIVWYRTPVLFFSGEATLDNYGPLIGAMESGKRAAIHVIDVLAGY